MLMKRKGEVRIFDGTEALRSKEFGKAGWLHWPWSREQALCPSGWVSVGREAWSGGGILVKKRGWSRGPSNGFSFLCNIQAGVCVCVAGDKRDRWVAREWGEGLNREWWRALTRLTSKMFGFLWPNAGNLPISEKEVDFPWSACFSYVWSMFLNSFPLWLLWSRVMMPADNCSVSYRSEREGFG